MSKTKRKLWLSIIVMTAIIAAGNCILGYLTYVIADYAINEAASKGEYVVCALAMSMPIFSVYLTILLLKEVKDDIWMVQRMR